MIDQCYGCGLELAGRSCLICFVSQRKVCGPKCAEKADTTAYIRGGSWRWMPPEVTVGYYA